ncbi:hypothetical protein G6F64_014962 [Rhizopus arrhizus]|uniref:Uncharacterized protein n=1 Tax=Rhizopus oryzae TaxID=64495 RepID=A0A9P6WSF4_RHIOR|nr:hypothetical protein G6F64_014962 [Rhizopus arrhizus]
MGDVGRERPDRRGQANAVQPRQVAIAQLTSAAQGPRGADAALVGTLHQPRLIGQQLVADLAGGQRVARHAFAQHLRHRTERHLEFAAAAIGLDRAHFEVAAVAARVEGVEDEAARRQGGR